jgi:hypothetical protein
VNEFAGNQDVFASFVLCSGISIAYRRTMVRIAVVYPFAAGAGAIVIDCVTALTNIGCAIIFKRWVICNFQGIFDHGPSVCGFLVCKTNDPFAWLGIRANTRLADCKGTDTAADMWRQSAIVWDDIAPQHRWPTS